MRFYTRQHRFYCGVDLHARSMHVCVLDQEGNVLVSKNIASAPEPFLELIAPCREDVVVAAECMFTWYWLADLCAREGLVFVLGHALYMRAIHGGKAKNDRIDAYKIAALLRGGMLPQAYVYPRRCARRAISCAGATTSCASARSCSRTSRTSITSTTCLH